MPPYLYGESGTEAAELLFSSRARPAIRLESESSRHAIDVHPETSTHTPCTCPGCHSLFQRMRFHGLVDGLMLLSAVLLFAVICMAMVGVVPAWPVALVMGAWSDRRLRRAVSLPVLILDRRHAG